MRDDQTRVLVSDWKRIRKYVPFDPRADSRFTPKFGYIIDYLREKYGIYVWGNPVTNAELDIDTEDNPRRVYNFRSEVRYVKKTIVYRDAVFNDISYYLVIRKAINKAIDFLEADGIG